MFAHSASIFNISFLVTILLISPLMTGCTTTRLTTEQVQLLEDSKELAKDRLFEKLTATATRYAKGSESAESIGHAVTTACAQEIADLVETHVDALRPQLSGGYDKQIRINDFRKRNLKSVRDMVWRTAVAVVVEERTNPSDSQVSNNSLKKGFKGITWGSSPTSRMIIAPSYQPSIPRTEGYTTENTDLNAFGLDAVSIIYLFRENLFMGAEIDWGRDERPLTDPEIKMLRSSIIAALGNPDETKTDKSEATISDIWSAESDHSFIAVFAVNVGYENDYIAKLALYHKEPITDRHH